MTLLSAMTEVLPARPATTGGGPWQIGGLNLVAAALSDHNSSCASSRLPWIEFPVRPVQDSILLISYGGQLVEQLTPTCNTLNFRKFFLEHLAGPRTHFGDSLRLF